MVYVISSNGQPLMPTENHAKVRILLKTKKAKVIKKCPFTIQLLYSSTNYTQPVSLGVDAGSKHIGLSATTKDKVLFESDVELRNERNQAPYEVKGFRLFDKVQWKGQKCFIFGRRSTGRMDLRLLDGTHINASVGYKNLKFKNA